MKLASEHSGAHGSSLNHVPSLSDNLVGVRVVQADGTLRNITDEATLRHYKVNLGTLGIITHFTFPVVPLFKVQWTTIPYDESVLTNGTLLDLAKQSDGIYVYW
jgi:FAD/FMN-containing dehydrogenase